MHVSIPVRVAVIVGLWTVGVGFIFMQAIGYADVLGRFGTTMCLAGTMLAAFHTSNKQTRMLRQAFELGQETERAKVTALR